MHPINRLKTKLKHGPKLRREWRVEYAWVAAQLPVRKISPATLEKLRVDLARLSANPDKKVQRFVAAMKHRCPGLLG